MNAFNRFAVIFCILLSACSGGDAASGSRDVAPEVVVLVVETSGGCMMAGPNCPRYVLMANGEFDIYRGREDKVEASGIIDKTLVDDLVSVAAEVDFMQLRSSLAPGVCRGCFDGIDAEYILLPRTRNERIDSKEFKVSSDIPLFNQYLDILDKMLSVAQLPFVQRQ